MESSLTMWISKQTSNKMETHSSFTKLTSLGFLFLFTVWCSSLFAAFAISEEVNSLLKWKSTLSTESQSVLSSWVVAPADQYATNSTSNINPCTWHGISCNGGSVARLNLSNSGLKGTLAEFPFSSLSNLTHIDFYINELFGILPPRISNLSNLVYLDLSFNLLQGKIPPEIGQLQHLEILHLESNSFKGPIPFTFRNLKKLSLFYLYSNFLSGPIPSELGNLTSLTHLLLLDNYLNGAIPKSIGSLENLVILYLTQNQLSGPIPSELGNLTSLTLLNLRGNNLNGSIPKSIGNLKNLDILHLGENQLSGPIPSSMANLVNLTYLSLAFSNLSGTNANFTLPKLERLNLSFCDLNQFPEFIRESNNLIYLDLLSNKIEGPIPKWMWDLGKDTLRYLGLSNNSLTGGLESFSWKYIVYIDLRSNMFQGALPEIGEISSGICNIDTLEFLDLSHNNFSGKIPRCFSKLSKSLSVLNLQMNNFQGKIPSEFPGNGCVLLNLNLHGNQMEGPLPRSLANCGRLEVLDIGNNNIKDTFPTWLGSLNELQVLVLRSNGFHGIVSSNIDANSSFPKLRILDLSDNDFNGSLPVRYIENLKAMVDTHKAGNSATYMQYGEASFVNFNYEFSVFVTLKGQNIEMEKILTIFASIDLSKNKFIGEIPDVIGSLHSLKGLNLSHNNLGGPISPSIGGLINLESLDLSCNKLVGRIPEELLSLTQLEVLDLSNNQLVGRIPQGNQLDTFGNDSYQGNLGLCGLPLSKTCSGPEQPPAFFQEKDEFWEFGWRPIAIGFGCGTLFGFLTGYLMFQMGKPRWFVSLFDFYPYLRARRMNRAKRLIQRRN